MVKNGIRLEDADELRSLIDRIKKYTGDLEEANSNMLKDINAAEEFFEGRNYDSFRENWVNVSEQITKFVGEAPEVIGNLEKVYGVIVELLSIR